MRVKTEPVTINGIEYQTSIATVDSTILGIEDHGILSFTIFLSYLDGGVQGAGGYGLDGADPKDRKKRKGSIGAAIIIRRCLEVIGVDNWENLKGKYVIALREPGFNGWIRGLMSMTHKEDYVIFEDCFRYDKKIIE